MSLRQTLESLPSRQHYTHSWTSDDGQPLLLLQQLSDGWTLRVPHIADFFTDRSCRSIQIDRVDGLRNEVLEHLLIDQVLPRVIAQRGEMVMHAAAVELDGRVALFAGAAGSGKSTLCAALGARGCRVLTDDCVLLRLAPAKATAIPTYPSLRVLPDTLAMFFEGKVDPGSLVGYNDKRRLPLPAPTAPHGGYSVAAVYFIDSRDRSRTHGAVTRRVPSGACIDMLANTFRLDPTDRILGAELFSMAARFVQRIPTFTLEVPGMLRTLREDAVRMAEQLIGQRSVLC